jgi:hypothetical protein
VVDEKGTQHEHYNLYAEDVPAFSVRLTDKAVNWLKIRGAADVGKHFVGKWIRVEGSVYGVGLDLIYRPTQWTYHLDLNSQNQLSEIEPATLEAGSEPSREHRKEFERPAAGLEEDPFGDPPAKPAAPDAETRAAADVDKPTVKEKPAAEEPPAPEKKPAEEEPPTPATPAAEGAQPSENAQFSDGWAPYKNSQTLAAMTDWVVAWDEQIDQRGGNKRRAILRVFPDGRVAAVRSLGDPLVQARITAPAVAELVDRLQQQGTRRAIDQAMVVQNNIPLQADDYEQLQA